MHGGSANPDVEIAAVVREGSSKINISSDIKEAFYRTCRDVLSDPVIREPNAIYPPNASRLHCGSQKRRNTATCNRSTRSWDPISSNDVEGGDITSGLFRRKCRFRFANRRVTDNYRNERRKLLLILLLFESPKETSINRLSACYFVARASIVNDLAAIEPMLLPCALRLVRSRKGTYKALILMGKKRRSASCSRRS